jgi:hypothetical protein
LQGFAECGPAGKQPPNLEEKLRDQNRLPLPAEGPIRAIASGVLQTGDRDSRFAIEALKNLVPHVPTAGSEERRSGFAGLSSVAGSSRGRIRRPGQRDPGEHCNQFTECARSVHCRSRRQREPEGSGEFIIHKSEYVRESQMQEQNVSGRVGRRHRWNVGIRILSRKTGAQMLDTGVLRIQLPPPGGNAAIPVAQRVPIGSLPPVAYRIELEARDTAGHVARSYTDLEIEPLN